MINLQKGIQEPNNPQVFVIWWSDGEPYDERIKILKIFSNKDNALAYYDKWREDYKKACDEINAGKEEGWKIEFSETIWIDRYDLH